MQDIESQSLWSQISGEAIVGSMEGTRLELLPSSLTTFEEFRKSYPDGLILEKSQRGLPNSRYKKYSGDRTKLGIFGRVDRFRRLDGKELVVGLRSQDKQVAVALKRLKHKGSILIADFQPPVLLVGDKKGISVNAFSLDGFDKKTAKSIKLMDGLLISKESDLSWNVRTGALLSGSGTDLKLFPMTKVYWFAWASFFPDTKLIK